jgi:hydroxypyruvate isomerase
MHPNRLPLRRRDSFRLFAAAAALAGCGSPAPAQDPAPVRKGRIRQAVVRNILGKMPIEPFCRTLRQLGIAGVDFAPRDEWPALRDHGLMATLVAGAGQIRDGLNNTARHAEFLRQFRQNITAAADFGWKRVIAMAGDREGISDAEGLTACAAILREAVRIAADHDVTICMELLNSKVDHPGYMCDRTAWGAALCDRVASPHFKLLYDIYHMQIMEGDLIRTIRGHITRIGHFHTAGNPGRRDLDSDQELNYPAILRALAALQEEGKFDGYVAHEFSPKRGIESLRHAVELCDV